MKFRLVQCPKCGTRLKLPPDFSHVVARCGSCHARLFIPRQINVSDDAIVSWLKPSDEGSEEQVELAEQIPPSGKTTVLPAVGADFQLVSANDKGALFDFPAYKLLDPHFRSAMPRRCLQCGSTTNLQTHVVIYARELKDSMSLENRYGIKNPSIEEQGLRDLDGEEILKRLPHVPNVPRPADLPMPYWLCRLCRNVPAVSGQLRVSSRTGQRRCRLLIKDLRSAEEFLVACGFANTPLHAELHEQIRTTGNEPWDTLPPVVQHRLKQWFNPGSKEVFIAYVPDRDHARLEDGISGLVISTRRFIFHTDRQHAEVPLEKPLKLKLVEGEQTGQLEIRSASCRVKHFHLDSDGVRELRKGLETADFKVSWG